MGALSAQAAEIPIIYLPYTISAPGNYVLKSNLPAPQFQGTGITIIPSATNTGPVVLDMKGHSLVGSAIMEEASNVTIRNGSIVGIPGGGTGLSIFKGVYAGVATNVVINNLSFDLDLTDPLYSAVGDCITLIAARNCTISNCTFKDSAIGIYDYADQGENIFTDDAFAASVTTSITILQPPPISVPLPAPVTINRLITSATSP